MGNSPGKRGSVNLQFETADLSDAPVIFSQAKELIDRYEDISSIDCDKVLAWVKKKIETHISEYRFVWKTDQKVAYYRLCENGELDDLYVLPVYQGQGIGSEILKRCIAESKADMYLYVFRDNVRAIAFYERFGFSVQKTVGHTRFIMSRKG